MGRAAAVGQWEQRRSAASESHTQTKLLRADLEHRFLRLEDRLREDTSVELRRCLHEIEGIGLEDPAQFHGPVAPIELCEQLQGPFVPPDYAQAWYGLQRLWENTAFDIDKARKEVRVLTSRKEQMLIAFEDFAVLVHKDNPIESLTVAQLADVWGADGKISAWSGLGVKIAAEPDAKIVLVGAAANTSSAEMFRTAVLWGRGQFRAEITTTKGAKEIADTVTRSPSAIAYCPCAYAAEGVRAVPVAQKAGDRPLLPGVADTNYPLRRTYYAYFRDEPAGRTKAFAMWFRKPEAQAVMKELGLLPPKP